MGISAVVRAVVRRRRWRCHKRTTDVPGDMLTRKPERVWLIPQWFLWIFYNYTTLPIYRQESCEKNKKKRRRKKKMIKKITGDYHGPALYSPRKNNNNNNTIEFIVGLDWIPIFSFLFLRSMNGGSDQLPFRNSTEFRS